MAPKALFITPLDEQGGAEGVLATVVTHLSGALGWSVRVISLGARHETSFMDRLPGDVRVSYGRGAGGAPSEWKAVLGLAGQSYDLAFATNIRANVALSTARRFGVLKCGRLVTRESTLFADRYSGGRLAAYKALYRLYGQQDLIIAQTSDMAERLAPVLPAGARGRLAVLPNPVDPAVIGAALAAPVDAPLAARLAARPHIAWCGRMIGVKQPLLALDVLKLARERSSLDLGLVMIGAGPMEDETRAYAASLGLGDALTLTGHIANPHSVFAACHYGLMTSRSEGFPNVLLEMMACGVKRIVSTPCAGDLDTLDGVIVAGPDARSLADALVAEAPGSSIEAQYAAALERRTPAAFVSAVIGA